jgi:para-nitrobenzyl esterase
LKTRESFKLLSATVLLGAVVIMTASTSRAARAIVIDQGPLKGINTEKVNMYLGIPYAAPPVGNLRWMPPQPPAKFKGLFRATQFGSACPQAPTPPFGDGSFIGDENCLFLNVYTPTGDAPPHGFPVMVWIHGGSFTSLKGSEYDPSPLVEKGNVIVVTINYRLGALGVLAHPALDSEDHLKANYQLMDQQFALRWVRRNIGAFGGNRQLITVFGESSGAINILAHLASSTAAGLFERAIMESQAFDFQDYFPVFASLADAETSGTAFAASVGCASQTAQCLRSVPASTLVAAQPGLPFPIVDGTVLTQAPDTAISNGQFIQVPVMIGTNHDEGRFAFVAASYDYLGTQLTDGAYQAAVAATLGLAEDDPFVLLLANVVYPLTNYPPPPGVQSAPLALGALTTDLYFACPSEKAEISLSNYVPTYAYEFNDENAPLIAPLTSVSFPLGAYHGAEQGFIFNVEGIPTAFSPAEQQLSDTMIGYWTRFAKAGDPNYSGAPTWSPYSATTGQLESLLPPTPAAEFGFDAGHKCSSLWDTF